MSDKEREEGTPIDWDELGQECAVLAHELEGVIGAALGLPDGRSSWMHIVGTAFLLLQRSLTCPGSEPAHIQWVHGRLLVLHEATHRHLDGGVEDARAFFEAVEQDAVAGAPGCQRVH